MSFGVATLRAVVHADDKTSGDARSWYMISGDTKSWVSDLTKINNQSQVVLLSVRHAALVVLHDALRALVDMLLVAMLVEDVPLVMSTPAYVDLETITQADGAQSSRVPVPLPDDPYVAVRQAQLVETESELEEAPSEAEELESLGSRVPRMGEEFEASESSGTRTISSHSPASSDSTAPLSPDHPLTHVSPTPTPTQVLFHRRTARMAVRAQPTLSPGMSARIEEAVALSPSSFRKRALRRRELAVEEDQVPSTFEVDPEDDRVYTDILGYAPPAAPVQTPPSPEWSSGSLHVSPSSVVPSPIASLVATPTATISADED
ncbi:hypothetical protein Tco_1257438 [Tanacetum coccineum]